MLCSTGLVVGHLLSNILINGFIYAIENSKVCNFADDSTFYSCEDSINTIFRSLKGDINNAIKWFKVNRRMVENPDKFQVSSWALRRVKN